jgi:hypothetical protein
MSNLDKIEEAPEITPQVLHLRDLLKWVRQGRIRVPNFQRDFTWDRVRMLNLFDSIRKQYPIGTLLFWESLKARPMLDVLGPLALPDYSSGKLLVLDGQQRLTTLAGVLLFDEMRRDLSDANDPKRWIVWYDAESDDFAYFDDPPLSAVKVSDLMGTKGLYAAAQRIMTAPEDDLFTTRDQWVSRIEAVSAALGAYRLPLVIFATESLRLAVESFTRLNRSGQAMGADEMFSALTYEAEEDDEHFRLSKHIDVILSAIARRGFGQIDRVVVLRAVLLAAELDPFRTEWDELAADTQKHAAAKLPTAIAEASRGLLSAVEFLQEEGIFNSRLLPYSMQLVGLAAFFGRRVEPVTQAQKDLLRRWFWVNGFTEGFGALNPSRILKQLKDLRDVIPFQESPTVIDGIDLEAPAHPFPERHDHRSARVRALLCVMLRKHVLLPDGTKVTSKQMADEVLQRGPEAMARICARVENRGKVPLGSSPANRIFDVIKEKRGQAKGWLVELVNLKEEFRNEILNSHYISAAAFEALLNNENTVFVERRTETLMELERSFMKEKGVTPPISHDVASSAIDIEEQVPLSESYDVDVRL